MLEFCFPPVCACCDVLLSRGGSPLCATCRADATAIPPEDRVRAGHEALVVYEGTWARILHQLKYQQRLDRIPVLAALLEESTLLRRPWDVIVPIPLHWTRRLTRGFNQVTLILRAGLGRSGRPPRRCVTPAILRRVRRTPPLAGLGPEHRRRAVEGVFTVPRRPGTSLHDRRVLLVDDVVTTGATLRAATLAVREYRPREVGTLALMRAG